MNKEKRNLPHSSKWISYIFISCFTFASYNTYAYLVYPAFRGIFHLEFLDE
jgi:hypothetical protein